MSEQNPTPTDPKEPIEIDLQAELEKMTQIAQRALADLSNYKQQVAKERQQMQQFAQIKVLDKFFPIIDSFNLAIKNMPAEQADEAFGKGVVNIYKMLNKVTSDLGLSPIASDKLDSNLHEVISVIPGEKDKIIETIEQGYMLGEVVIRPSKVVVGSGE